MAVFCYFFIKETKGISLEHMDAIFGGVDHVVAGEEKAMEAGETLDAEPDTQGIPKNLSSTHVESTK